MEKWTTTQKMIWLRGNPATGGGGNPEVDLTVTGHPPLTLPNATAKPLVKLTQYGNTWIDMDETPTPTSPKTLVCNAGGTYFEDMELGDDYKRLKGIKFDGNTYYQVPDLYSQGWDTVMFSMSVEAACNVFGCYTTPDAQNNYSLYVSTASNAKYLRYNGGTYKSQFSSSTFGTRYDITISPYGSSGMPTGQDDTWDEAEFESSTEMCIGTTSPTATSAKFKGNMYGNFVVNGAFLGIPVERVSDGKIGYFDTYNWNFIEPVGSNPESLGYDLSQYKLYWYNISERISLNNGTPKWLSSPLLSAGNVKDDYEFVSGVKTTRTNYRFLNGDESYSTSSTYGAAVVISSAANTWNANSDCTPVCSHFVGLPRVSTGAQADGTCFFDIAGNFCFRTSMSAADFKAWVTAQFEAGTPVILVYAKATPSTENFTPWAPTLEQGTNTIAVTNTNASKVTFEAVYKGKAG